MAVRDINASAASDLELVVSYAKRMGRRDQQ